MRCNVIAFFCAAFSIAAAFGVIACGASYQSLYESDVRFEHCYRLDTDASVPARARQQCWSEWTRAYTTGQSRDRVEYAFTRQHALLTGDPKAVGLLLTDTKNPGASLAIGVTSVACPLPKTPFEAPPATLAPSSSAYQPMAAPAASTPSLSPSQLCAQDCGQAFTACVTTCKQNRCIARCGDMAKRCISECL